MKSFFLVNINVTVADDWTVEDVKYYLAEWAQEHNLKIEGLIRQVISLDVRDNEYFQV